MTSVAMTRAAVRGPEGPLYPWTRYLTAIASHSHKRPWMEQGTCVWVSLLLYKFVVCNSSCREPCLNCANDPCANGPCATFSTVSRHAGALPRPGADLRRPALPAGRRHSASRAGCCCWAGRGCLGRWWGGRTTPYCIGTALVLVQLVYHHHGNTIDLITKWLNV